MALYSLTYKVPNEIGPFCCSVATLFYEKWYDRVMGAPNISTTYLQLHQCRQGRPYKRPKLGDELR